eukprot:TRINITY_DN35943_c0_g1_i1.p1 TRINITY_DN35943_c0_g1~~TRINITY_DN35943_c0_g1_i1.p1  ORF type:complete len:984 (+),score=267.05 TRINITY_DN35943_c0_g1_i1:48-2954(+)
MAQLGGTSPRGNAQRWGQSSPRSTSTRTSRGRDLQSASLPQIRPSPPQRHPRGSPPRNPRVDFVRTDGADLDLLNCDTFLAVDEADAADAAAAAAAGMPADVGPDATSASAHSLQVRQWMDSFVQENAEFKSPSNYAQIALGRILRTTEDLPRPHRLRAEATLQLLERTTGMFSGYSKLLDSIRSELIGSVYLPRPVAAVQQPRSGRAQGSQPANFRRAHLTYFEAFEEIEWRYRQVEFKARTMEEQMDRRARVLQRAIQSWQIQLKRKTFRDWRSFVVRQAQLRDKYRKMFTHNVQRARLQAAWRNWEATVERLKLQEATQAVKDTTLSTLNAKEAIEQLMREMGERLGRLADAERAVSLQKQAIAQAQQSKRSGDTKINRIRLGRAHLALVASVFLCSLERSHFEFQAREESSSLLGIKDAGIDFLIAWAKDLIGRTSFAAEGQIRDFAAQVRTVKIYVYLLRAMAPVQCSEGWVVRVNSEVDPARRAEIVLEKAREMGVDTVVTPQDIINGLPELNHLLLAQLFQCFADRRPLGRSPPMLWDKGTLAERGATRDVKGKVSGRKRLVEATQKRRDREDTASGPTVQSLHADAVQAAQDVESDRQSSPVPVDALRAKWKQMAGANNAWELRSVEVLAEARAGLVDAARRGGERPQLTAKQEQEMQQYTRVPVHFVAEFLPPPPDQTSAHDQLIRLLDTRGELLKKVYRFYCTSGDIAMAARQGTLVKQQKGAEGSLNTMSRAELYRFVHDCKLLGKRLKRPQLDALFTKVVALRRGADGGDQSYDSELIPVEFTALLCHLSNLLFRRTDDQSIAERVARLLDTEVGPRACSSEVDTFRAMIYRPDVQRTLREHRDELTRTFLHFACQSKELGRRDDSTMDLDEWKAFIKTGSLIDSVFNERASKAVFLRLQDDEGEEEVSLSYAQFCEALVAIACYKVPSPFEPLTQRLKTFLQKLRANLHGKVRGI